MYTLLQIVKRLLPYTLQRKKKKGGKNAREREKTTPKSFSVGREREREECCGFIERESTHTQNKKRRGGKV